MKAARIIGLVVATSAFACVAHAAPYGTASQVMTRLQKEYAGLRDYQVGLVVRITMPQVDIADTPVTAYYRAPDRTALVARTFAFVPEQGVFLLPTMFGSDRFTPLGLRTEGSGKAMRYHLQLQPKPGVLAKLARSTMIITPADSLLASSVPDVPIDLWVDPTDWTISRVKVRIPRGPTHPGISFDATSRYSQHTGYRLPDRTTITLKLDEAMPSYIAPRKPGMDARAEDLPATREPTRGKIVLTFTNYRVNRGVPDNVFIKRKGF